VQHRASYPRTGDCTLGLADLDLEMQGTVWYPRFVSATVNLFAWLTDRSDAKLVPQQPRLVWPAGVLIGAQGGCRITASEDHMPAGQPQQA
jgi:hypothetical protein